MNENEYRYTTYRSGSMTVIVVMFLVLFSAALVALTLMATGIIASSTPALVAVAAAALLTGLAVWNFEVGIEMRPEGLVFKRLVKPEEFVSYTRIQRVGIRYVRGMYYCFIRYGDGLFSGTFFPVEYYGQDGRDKTNAFLKSLALRAGLEQTEKTPLGAPIYVRRRGDY